MNDDSPDEQSPETPVEAASAWLGHVFRRRDLLAAWPLMASALRRSLVEGWYDANRSHPLVATEDRSALIDGLCEMVPVHPL